MWALEYSEEVKLYFVDNGDLVFDVLVKIEELKFLEDGIPEGVTPLQAEVNTYRWPILGHWVVYEKLERQTPTLKIWLVKPR